MEDEVETPELPLEIIVYILRFLSWADRKEASLVSRRWYDASQDVHFQRNVTFSFPASSASLDLIRGLSRKSSCSLIISQLDGFRLSRDLLQEVGRCVGSNLRSLSLPGSSVTESSLLLLLPLLTSLRRLDLRGLDSLFMSGAFLSREEHRQQVRAALCGLEDLDLSDLRYLSDVTFDRLTGCTPRLHRLALAGCRVAFQFDPYRGKPVGAAGDSSAMLSLRNLRRLLVDQRSTLVTLDLSRTSITPESLRTIAQVPDLVLEDLALGDCRELTDRSVEVLVLHQTRIQRLDLSGCTELSSRSVEVVTSGLQSLKTLNLSRDWRVSEKGLSGLLSLSSLKSLDVSECLHVSGTEMVKGLTGSRTSRLETLSLKSCTYIRDLSVFSLTQLLGESLRELDLTSCVNVSDVSVRGVSTYLQRLQLLRLSRCCRVSDLGLLGVVEVTTCDPDHETGDNGPKFTRTFGNMGFFKPPRLPFEERPKLVTHNALQQFQHQAGASLLALTRLQELDLSACPKVTDASITQVIRFPDLRRLSLARLPEVTDLGLVSVAERCRGLTSLDLSYCSGVSDLGLQQAAPTLHRLQHLHLAGCDITDRSLFVLSEHCPRLKTLDVSRCKNISAAAVDIVQSRLPFLENFHHKYIGGGDPAFTL